VFSSYVALLGRQLRNAADRQNRANKSASALLTELTVSATRAEIDSQTASEDVFCPSEAATTTTPSGPSKCFFTKQ
jgi:hypothetical protein